MTTQIDTPVEERIVGVLRHLGIERAHFASRNLNDWYGMASGFPDAVASLTLVCPLGFDSSVLATLAENLLVFNGARGGATETISRNMAALPSASMVTLDDYAYANNYADIAVERDDNLAGPLLDFLAGIDAQDGPAAVSPAAEEGELTASISRSRAPGRRWCCCLWALRRLSGIPSLLPSRNGTASLP